MAFFTASRTLPLLALLAATAFTSCKDDKNEEVGPITAPATPDFITPVIASTGTNAAYGQLLTVHHDFRYYANGVKLSDDYITNLQTLSLDMARARFSDTPGAAAAVDAGTVTANGITLDKASDNTYSKTADFILRQGVNWAATNVNGAALAYSNFTPLPAYTGNIPSVINLTSGSTVNLIVPLGGSNVAGADSIVVVVQSGSQKVVRRVPYSTGVSPNVVVTPSVTFTPAQLAALPAALAESNSATIQVAVFRKANVNINGRAYSIAREAVVTAPVRIDK